MSSDPKSPVDRFEAIVKQTVGDKQAFNTFSYDDVMAVVTAARAAVQCLDGLPPKTVNNYAPEPGPATDDVPPPNAPNTGPGEGAPNDEAPQYVPS